MDLKSSGVGQVVTPCRSLLRHNGLTTVSQRSHNGFATVAVLKWCGHGCDMGMLEAPCHFGDGLGMLRGCSGLL